MMATLAAWIRTLILLLVAASLVDMALPGGQLRRYVDVVVGLVILATILTPLFGWLGGDLESSLTDTLAGLQGAWDQAPTAPASELPARAMEWYRSETQRLFAERLAQHIHDGLEQDLAVPVRRVEVQVNGVDTGGQPQAQSEMPSLAAVTVWLEAGEENGVEAGTTAAGESSSNLVRINIDPITITPGAATSVEKPAAAAPAWQARIQRWLSERLGVTPNSLHVVMMP